MVFVQRSLQRPSPARRFSLFFHPTELVAPETLKDLLAEGRRLLARHSHGCPPCSPRSPAIASASGHSCERHRARSAVFVRLAPRSAGPTESSSKFANCSLPLRGP